MAGIKDIDKSKLPVHVAVIMDGNGRWAREKGKHRIFGHRAGVQAVRETAECAAEMGIKYLTLYAFSTENWNRPSTEVSALMQLLVRTIRAETKTLTDNNIRLNALGNIESLPKICQRELHEAMKITEKNSRMTLNLALSYSGRWDIVEAVKKISRQVKQNVMTVETITDSVIKNNLSTHNIPDPELLIRTSGENRISNFLLWEIAYTELFISQKLWPDFRKADFCEAILDYQKRERRFGKTSGQLN